METEKPAYLLLSAQRALLDQVTPNLRAFSVEKDGKTVRTLAVFAEPPTADEIENMQAAGTEIIADYIDEAIEERIEVSTDPRPPSLERLAYRRHEPE